MPQNIPTKPTTSKALTASYLSQWIASVAIVWPAVVEIFCSGRNASRITAYPTAYRLVAAMGRPPPTGDDGPCAIQAYWSPPGCQVPVPGSYLNPQASMAWRHLSDRPGRLGIPARLAPVSGIRARVLVSGPLRL